MVHIVHARMRFNLLLFTVLYTAGLSSAIASEDPAVQEFQNQAKSLGESITKDNSGISDHCQRLFQDIQDLKGKPQRRYTARQLYDRECRRSMSYPDSEFGGEQPGFPSGFNN